MTSKATSTKTVLLLILFLLNKTKASVVGNNFKKVTIGKIPQMYERSASFHVVKMKYNCAAMCSRSETCVYFLYSAPLYSCGLLGFDVGASTVISQTDYLSWDTYILGTAHDCNVDESRVFIRQFEKCIRIDTGSTVSWTDSQAACEAESGYLLNIDNMGEFTFFRNIFSAIAAPDTDDFFNVGLRMDDSGNFVWINDAGTGSEINSVFWAPENPDFVFEDEWCVASRLQDDFYLNNISCDWYYGYFVCEY